MQTKDSKEKPSKETKDGKEAPREASSSKESALKEALPKDRYDCIVIGNHPGALLAGCLSAHLGWKVLILPGPMPEPNASSGDPEPNFLLGATPSSDTNPNKQEGLLLQLFAQMGMVEKFKNGIEHTQCDPQVLTPRVRLNFNREGHLENELEREFGRNLSKSIGLAEALKKSEADHIEFWSELPKKLVRKQAKGEPVFKATLSTKSLQRKFRKKLNRTDREAWTWFKPRIKMAELSERLGEPDLRDLGAGLWHQITFNEDSNPNLFSLLHLLSLSRTACSFKGGMPHYRQFLLQQAKDLGAQVVPDGNVEEVIVKKGEFLGVRYGKERSIIQAQGRAVILGCSLKKIASKMSVGRKPWGFSGRLAFHPVGWRFTLALKVKKEVIPAPFKKRLIWQEDGAPPLEFELATTSKKDLKDDEHILYLRTRLPFTEESLKAEFQKRIGKRMIRQASEVFPFLEDNLIETHVSAQNYPALGALPDTLLIYGSKGIGSKTEIRGLYVASQEAYPALGSLGPTVAAVESVVGLIRQEQVAKV